MEIVFVDQQVRRVTLLRKRGSEYERRELTGGELTFETIPGFALEVAWLFADPRPDELKLLNAMLQS